MHTRNYEIKIEKQTRKYERRCELGEKRKKTMRTRRRENMRRNFYFVFNKPYPNVYRVIIFQFNDSLFNIFHYFIFEMPRALYVNLTVRFVI